MDPQHLYLELYKEYRVEIRHQETQRSAVSTICVGLAAGLIGLIFQEGVNAGRPYLGLVLLNFSLVAILMLRKLYERFALARKRAQLYLSHIDKCPHPVSSSEARILPERSLIELWTEGRALNEKEYWFFSFVRLHDLWESLLIGAGLLGGGFFLLSLWSPKTPTPSHSQLCWLLVTGPTTQLAMLCGVRWWGKKKELARRKIIKVDAASPGN